MSTERTPVLCSPLSLHFTSGWPSSPFSFDAIEPRAVVVRGGAGMSASGAAARAEYGGRRAVAPPPASAGLAGVDPAAHVHMPPPRGATSPAASVVAAPARPIVAVVFNSQDEVLMLDRPGRGWQLPQVAT